MTFTADPESFVLLRDELKIGAIHELNPQDAGLLAPHIPQHTGTLFVAASGIPIESENGDLRHLGSEIAIEWVRVGDPRKHGQPEVKMYRYVLGLTEDGRCLGVQVWDRESTPHNLQVGDHWMKLQDVLDRYLQDDGAQP